jgi:hypothetical protein
MAAYKTWTIGDVLTAADLNASFQDLPLNTAAFTANYSASTGIAINTSVTISVTLPASRFDVAPIVNLTTTDGLITPYVSSVTNGTVVVGLRNNGNATSGTAFTIYGFAVQMTSGTAAG